MIDVVEAKSHPATALDEDTHIKGQRVTAADFVHLVCIDQSLGGLADSKANSAGIALPARKAFRTSCHILNVVLKEYDSLVTLLLVEVRTSK